MNIKPSEMESFAGELDAELGNLAPDRYDAMKYLRPTGEVSLFYSPDLIENYTFFSSGHTGERDMEGFALAGMGVGSNASDCSMQCQDRIVSLLDQQVPVFVDSGAFQEIQTGEEIGHEKWLQILDLYRTLAQRTVHPESLFVVAPDKIGDQVETLRRLRKYQGQIREIESLGANILVALQPGNLSPFDFENDARESLELRDFVSAFPVVKSKLSLQDLAAYLQSRKDAGDTNVRLHFLGMSPRRKELRGYVELILNQFPNAVISSDASIIGAVSPTGRPLEQWERALEGTLYPRSFGDSEGIPGVEPFDYTEMIGDPSSWMSDSQKEKFVDELLTNQEREEWERTDPTTFFQADTTRFDVYQVPLDLAYQAHVNKHHGLTRTKRVSAIAQTFAPSIGEDTPSVTVISCGRTKRKDLAEGETSPAKDLYTSSTFSMFRRFAERQSRASGLPWFILSGLHGLMEPDRAVCDYTLFLGEQTDGYRKSWSRKVADQFQKNVDPGSTIDLLVSFPYTEYLKPLLENLGYIVRTPLHGLEQGEQRGWVSQKLKE